MVRRTTILLTLAVLLFMISPALAQDNVALVLRTPPVAIEQGAYFMAVVQVQAGNQSVDAVEVHLNFDPSKLEVISLTPGAALPLSIIQGTFNNSTGTIDYAGGALVGFPSGNFDVLNLTFRARAPLNGTEITFATLELPRKSEVTFQGTSVLDNLEGASVAAAAVELAAIEPITESQVIIHEKDGGTIVSEGDFAGDTYEISLSAASTSSVLVMMLTDGQCEVTPAVFFDPGVTEPQTVNVQAVDDTVVEDEQHPCIVSHRVASDDPLYSDVTVPSITVWVNDNDVAFEPLPEETIEEVPTEELPVEVTNEAADEATDEAADEVIDEVVPTEASPTAEASIEITPEPTPEPSVAEIPAEAPTEAPVPTEVPAEPTLEEPIVITLEPPTEAPTEIPPTPALVPVPLPVNANLGDSAQWTVAGEWALGNTDLGASWVANGASAAVLTWEQPIDLGAAQYPQLSFQSRSTGNGSVEVSIDGVNWMPLGDVPSGEAWQQADFDLRPFLGQVIRLRWSVGAGSQWSIAGIALNEATATPEPPTAEPPTAEPPTAEAPPVEPPTAEPPLVEAPPVEPEVTADAESQ